MGKRRKVGDGENPTLFEMGEAEAPASNDAVAGEDGGIKERPYDVENLWLGTSSFTAGGWAGTFYPKCLKSS